MSQIEHSNFRLQQLIDEIGQLKEQQQWWVQLDRFAQATHRSLKPTEIAYTIANDGRLLLGCDRLSVLVWRRGRYRVEAISGQETLNRRANTVRLMQTLCDTSLASGESLRYPEGLDQFAPQITGALDAYLDQSHAKALLLFPLVVPRDESSEENLRHGSAVPIGAIAVEQFSDAEIDEVLCGRAEVMGQHAATGLSNAVEHDRVFLLPLSSAVAKLSTALGTHSIPRGAVLTICLLILVVCVALMPADFKLTAEGTLQPERQRNVFARGDGVVSDLFVKEGSLVTEGQALAKLRNTELDVKMEEVAGQLRTTDKKFAALRASRLANMARPERDQVRNNELAAEEEELRQWSNSLQQQQALLSRQQAELELTSPIQGEVVTWSVQETLAARPVRRGQLLLTVADLEGSWVLELLLPDRRVGHLLAAQERLSSDLEVTFILATDPNQQILGRIKQVAGSTQIDEDGDQTVLVTVAFRKKDVVLRRLGAAVTAKIHCGRRTRGYVWLHDLIEFIQARILFRI